MDKRFRRCQIPDGDIKLVEESRFGEAKTLEKACCYSGGLFGRVDISLVAQTVFDSAAGLVIHLLCIGAVGASNRIVARISCVALVSVWRCYGQSVMNVYC